MNIVRIALKNFRSYEKQTFDLEPISVFRGMNGSGKSSLQMAIELALTGRCSVTDQAGRGGNLLIRSGKPEFEVLADVFVGSSDPGTRIRMRQNATGNTQVIEREGLQLAGKDAEQWIEQHIAPKTVLSAVLDSSRFLKFPEAAQKNLLASVLLPADTKFDDAISKLLEEMKFGSGEGGSLFERIDSLYKKAYEERTIVNRELRDSKSQTRPNIPEGLPEVSEIQEKLKSLQTELRFVGVARAEQRIGYEKSAAAFTSAQQRKDMLERNIAHTKMQAAQCESEMLSPEIIKELKKTAKDTTKVKALDKTIEDLQAAANLARKELQSAQSIEGESACPTCHQALTEDVLKWIYTLLIQANDAAQAKLRMFIADRGKLGDPVLAQSRLDAHGKASRQIDSFIESLRQADKDVAELDKQLEAGEPKAPDTSELDAQIQKLTERIQAGNEKLAEVAGYRKESEHWRSVEVGRTKSQKHLDKLQIIIDEFGADGMKARLLAKHLGKFMVAINRILNLFGYAAKIEMEPYSIQVRWKDREFLQLKQISESQQYRFAVALQIALAAVTDVRFVLVDRADILDHESIGSLYQALHEFDLLDQAIMLGTSSYKPAPEAAGEAFYYLRAEDGITEVELQNETVSA